MKLPQERYLARLFLRVVLPQPRWTVQVKQVASANPKRLMGFSGPSFSLPAILKPSRPLSFAASSIDFTSVTRLFLSLSPSLFIVTYGWNKAAEQGMLC